MADPTNPDRSFTPDPGPAPPLPPEDTGVQQLPEGASLEEILAAKLSGQLDATKTPTFLGVPDNYSVDLPRRIPQGATSTDLFGGPTNITVAPSYFSSDEYSRFVGKSPEWVGSVQDGLVDAGFISTNDVKTYGTWGGKETAAMKIIMATANRSGLNWREVLAGAIKTRAIHDASKPGRTVTVSNPDDLRAYFKDQAKTLTGGVFLSDNALDNMVKSYQKIERSSAGSGVSAPSAGTFAAGQIDKQDPGGAQANRFAQMAQVMTQLVGQV